MSDPENVIPIKLANGEGDWRSVLADMLVALNRYGHEIGDGDIPSAHRNLIWRAEQLLATPSSPVSAPSPAGEREAELERTVADLRQQIAHLTGKPARTDDEIRASTEHATRAGEAQNSPEYWRKIYPDGNYPEGV